MSQFERGKQMLGLSGKELTFRQKVKACEAACPAGGMIERIRHLEGIRGYEANKLLAEGISPEQVYFNIFYNEPLKKN